MMSIDGKYHVLRFLGIYSDDKTQTEWICDICGRHLIVSTISPFNVVVLAEGEANIRHITERSLFTDKAPRTEQSRSYIEKSREDDLLGDVLKFIRRITR